MFKFFHVFKKGMSLIWGTFWGNLLLKWHRGHSSGIVRCFGIPYFENDRPHSIFLGKHVILRSSLYSNPAGCFHPTVLATRGAGVLKIGDGTGISSSVIVAEQLVSLGKNVFVGVNSAIYDTDFHAVDSEKRKRNLEHGVAPVIIEDDVWLGGNVIVLKGVTIGKGSVIGAGSVVTRSIPPGVLAAGNPARAIRNL